LIDKEKHKQIALNILFPIKPTDENTSANKNFLLSAQRSLAGRNLPDYYLIFFLFADLLGFKNLGQFEKVAWSFPIDYKGKAYLIEYRKFGVGVFVQDAGIDEQDAEEITKKINGAVKSIRPYYDCLAEEAVKKSEFNIVNNNQSLYQRFDYLLNLYKKEYEKYLKYKDKTKIKTRKSKYGEMISYENLGFQYKQKANWIAISCIEAFFSWTEHLFIHLAVVAQNLSDGERVSRLIEDEWKVKFNAAIKDNSKEANSFYNELLIVRQQLRNFVTHGAFGKDGNAFRFHSPTGTVPVLMSHKKKKNRFSLQGYLTFKEEDVISLIEEFIKYLQNGQLAPAMYYTQHCGLPSILTMASDGRYEFATKDMDSMIQFSEYIIRLIDDSANMDW
jgi:hypothetical protein